MVFSSSWWYFLNKLHTKSYNHYNISNIYLRNWRQWHTLSAFHSFTLDLLYPNSSWSLLRGLFRVGVGVDKGDVENRWNGELSIELDISFWIFEGFGLLRHSHCFGVIWRMCFSSITVYVSGSWSSFSENDLKLSMISTSVSSSMYSSSSPDSINFPGLFHGKSCSFLIVGVGVQSLLFISAVRNEIIFSLSYI